MSRRRVEVEDGIAYETCDPEPKDPRTKEALADVARAAVAQVKEQQRTEATRLREALQRIVDYRPEFVEESEEEVRAVQECAECAEWRAKNHPIQRRCEAHVRQHYRYEDENKRRQASQHLALRDIARDALAGGA